MTHHQIPQHLLERANRARLRAEPEKSTVIGFTGFAQSGKDTAAAWLIERGWQKLAFAEPLRAAIYALNPIIEYWCSGPEDGDCIPEVWRVQTLIDEYGYEETKRRCPEYRELLQRFGTEVGRAQFGENFWADRVKTQVRPGIKYVITDVRFPNEVDTVHELGGKVFRIKRAGTNAVNAHVSDTGIEALVVDGILPNLSTMEHFRDLVLAVAGENLD